jgi:hypothetical protein
MDDPARDELDRTGPDWELDLLGVLATKSSGLEPMRIPLPP